MFECRLPLAVSQALLRICVSDACELVRKCKTVADGEVPTFLHSLPVGASQTDAIMALNLVSPFLAELKAEIEHRHKEMKSR